jgi:hypothetical protein
MHKNAIKCNKTQSKWCINKHGASKIIDTFEKYQPTQIKPCAAGWFEKLVETGLNQECPGLAGDIARNVVETIFCYCSKT